MSDAKELNKDIRIPEYQQKKGGEQVVMSSAYREKDSD
jgi:hypothetical protein